MYQSVGPAFMIMSKKLEGYLPFMYVDNHKDSAGNPDGLVTTGMGNLIDPVENALRLPWRHGVGGPLATQQEIMAAWNKVKHSGMNAAGGGNQGGLTDLRLDEAGIQQLINSKLTNNEFTLRQLFPRWDTLPADVQIVLLSMAWAMGTDKFHNFPKFMGYINQTVPNFRAAADECYMNDNVEKSLEFPPKLNPGLRPRNIANRLLLLNADKAISTGANLEIPFQPIADVMNTASQIAKGVITANIEVVKKNPFATAAGVTGLSLIAAAGTYYLATKKW